MEEGRPPGEDGWEFPEPEAPPPASPPAPPLASPSSFRGSGAAARAEDRAEERGRGDAREEEGGEAGEGTPVAARCASSSPVDPVSEASTSPKVGEEAADEEGAAMRETTGGSAAAGGEPPGEHPVANPVERAEEEGERPGSDSSLASREAPSSSSSSDGASEGNVAAADREEFADLSPRREVAPEGGGDDARGRDDDLADEASPIPEGDEPSDREEAIDDGSSSREASELGGGGALAEEVPDEGIGAARAGASGAATARRDAEECSGRGVRPDRSSPSLEVTVRDDGGVEGRNVASEDERDCEESVPDEEIAGEKGEPSDGEDGADSEEISEGGIRRQRRLLDSRASPSIACRSNYRGMPLREFAPPH